MNIRWHKQNRYAEHSKIKRDSVINLSCGGNSIKQQYSFSNRGYDTSWDICDGQKMSYFTENYLPQDIRSHAPSFIP